MLTVRLRIAKPWKRTFDRARLDMTVLQLDKTLGRKTQYSAVMQTKKGAKWGAICAVKAFESLPLITLVARLKTLGKIDLITVAAVQPGLHLTKLFAILATRHIGLPGRGKRKGRSG
nr:Uncharacterised protein [Salmonella sp. NCTC 7297]